MSEYFSDQDERDLQVWLKAADKRGLRPPEVYVRHELARRLSIPPWQLEDAPREVLEAEAAMMRAEADGKRYWKAMSKRQSTYNLNINTPREPIEQDFRALEAMRQRR